MCYCRVPVLHLGHFVPYGIVRFWFSARGVLCGTVLLVSSSMMGALCVTILLVSSSMLGAICVLLN